MNKTVYRVAVFLIYLVVCKSELHDIKDIPENIKTKENKLKTAFKIIPNNKENNEQVINQNTVNLLQYPNLPISIDNAKERIKRTVSEKHTEGNEKDFKAIENTNKRYKRMNYQEIPDQSLLDNEELKANIERLFGTETAVERAHEENQTVHSKDENILNPAEVQANIEMVFGKAPSISQRMGTMETNNPQSKTSSEPNADQDATKTVQQPALQTLIFQHFGPEVLDKDDASTNVHEATYKSNEGPTSVGPVTPTIAQETTPKIPDTNNGQKIQTGILLYVAYSIAVALFFV